MSHPPAPWRLFALAAALATEEGPSPLSIRPGPAAPQPFALSLSKGERSRPLLDVIVSAAKNLGVVGNRFFAWLFPMLRAQAQNDKGGRRERMPTPGGWPRMALQSRRLFACVGVGLDRLRQVDRRGPLC